MALNLDELIFKVDTKPLEDAVVQLDKLGKAISEINAKSKDSTKAALDENKVRQSNAKVAEAEAKARLANSKATEAESKALEKRTKATEEATKADKENQSVLERQKSILEFQAQGFSKGQSTVLAYAKASGALTTELKELGVVLQEQRKLMGGDPFDKSQSGITALKNRYNELKEAVSQYNIGSGLTREQTRELARDKERILLVMQKEGKALHEIVVAQAEYAAKYSTLAKQVNAMANSEKELERANRDKLNATRALAAEEERMTSVMKTLNGETNNNSAVSERAALQVARYERNLRLAGVGAADAAKKLAIYKQQVQQVQAVEEKRKTDYLARALAPQISDVVVSLGSGMNPMTVLLQQGLQVRDLIGQSGVEAAKLQATFKQAASDMVGSIKGTAVALGSLFIGAITDAGKAVLNFGGSLDILGKKSAKLREEVVGAFGEKSGIVSVFDSMMDIANVSFRAFITGATAFATAFLVASYQVMKASDDLAKSFAQFGASSGLTFDEMKAKAFDLSASTQSTFGTAVNAINEFSKAGFSSMGSYDSALKTAIRLQDTLGISVEDTAKKYAEVSKNPIKALIELGKQTGFVTEKQVRHIDSLIEQGRVQEAVNEATRLYTDSLVSVADTADQNLSEMSKLWLDVKKSIADTWGALQNFSESSDFWKGLRVVFATIQTGISQILTSIGGVATAVVAILHGDFKGAFGIITETYDKVNQQGEDYVKKVKDILSTTNAQAEQEKKQAEERKKNSDAMLALEKRLTEEKKRQKEEAKEADKLFKEWIKLKNKEATLEEQANKSRLSVYDTIKKINDELAKQTSDIDVKQSEVNMQTQLLGLTEEEAKRRQIINKYNLDNLKITEKYALERKKINDELNKEMQEAREKIAAAGQEFNEQDFINRRNVAIGVTIENEKRERAIAAQEMGNESAKQYYDAFKHYSDSITDIIYTALTEGGKSAGKKIRDLIQAELKKPIVAIIQAVVNLAMGSAAGALGFAPANAQAGSGTASGIFSMQGGSLGNNLAYLGNFTGNTSLATFGTGMGLTASEASAAASAYNAAGMTDIAKGLQTGQSWGSALNTAGSALSYANSLYSLSEGKYGQAAGSAIGTYFGGPIGGTIGGQLGSMVDSFFGGGGGPKVEGAATVTTAGVSSLTGKQGGEQAVAGFAADYINTLNSVMKSVNAKMSDQIGSYKLSYDYDVQGDAPDSIIAQIFDKAGNAIFGSAINKDKGQYAEGLQEQAARLTVATLKMSELNDDLQGLVEGIDPMTASLAELNTVITNLQGIQVLTNLFELLGFSVDQVSTALAEALGGFQNAQALFTSYYDNFYSEEEKRANVLKGIAEELQSAGSSLTAADLGGMTRDQFRKIYEGIVSVNGAADPLAVAMLQVSGAFANVTVAVESLESKLRGNVDKAFGALTKSVAYQKEKLKEQYDIQVEVYNLQVQAAQDMANKISGILNKLVSSKASTNIDSYQDNLLRYKVARDAIATAAASGDIFASNLEESLGLLSSNNTKYYATFTDYAKSQAQAATDIEILRQEAQDQLDAANSQVDFAKKQLDLLKLQFDADNAYYDSVLENAQQQLDALDGIDNSVKSVEQAIADLAAALLAMNAVKKDSGASLSSLVAQQVAAVSNPSSYNAMAANPASGIESDIASIYSSVLGRQADASGLSYWASSGMSLSDIQTAISSSPEAQARAMGVDVQNAMIDLVNQQLGLSTNIKAYAEGGFAGTGLALVGESGPELVNFRQPAQVYTASETASILSGSGTSNSSLVTELQALRNEVVMLRAETRATAVNTSKMSKQLDRTSGESDTLKVQIVTV